MIKFKDLYWLLPHDRYQKIKIVCGNHNYFDGDFEMIDHESDIVSKLADRFVEGIYAFTPDYYGDGLYIELYSIKEGIERAYH